MRTSTGVKRADESCPTSPVRSEGFMRNLSQAALEALDSIKFETGYPQGSTLFAEVTRREA
jgi:hypothetical protein